ncbi:hypothetical protein NP233_g6246 [Leucocoprinus birnbaumii]|uniref:factor independent urate hydroxylase n=1 Tax=Leucocoprinus birnbaumii TaxID=56174 RepID=A0AAD5VSJ6_9AGAR|nr:hypothetical protein NP233_g6246 [Leucocoprinus birnbaumii]
MCFAARGSLLGYGPYRDEMPRGCSIRCDWFDKSRLKFPVGATKIINQDVVYTLHHHSKPTNNALHSYYLHSTTPQRQAFTVLSRNFLPSLVLVGEGASLARGWNFRPHHGVDHRRTADAVPLLAYPMLGMSATSAEISTLSYAKYGKTAVRVFRVVREGKWHHIVEYNVTALLEGAIETSYTQADNSVVVATDSNLAKVSPHILSPEKFALHLGTFFISKYAHITKAHVDVEQLRWTRIQVPGEQKDAEDHSHAFWRDGEEKRTVSVIVDGTAGKDKLVASVSAGISGLLGMMSSTVPLTPCRYHSPGIISPVLKSTGSAFEGFVKDEFTTLVPVNDRIFSTAVDLKYTFKPLAIAAPKDDQKLEFKVPIQSGAEGYAGSVWDESVSAKARKATLEVFALDESASVQVSKPEPFLWIMLPLVIFPLPFLETSIGFHFYMFGISWHRVGGG